MVRPVSGAGVHVVLAGLGDTFGASLLKFVHGIIGGGGSYVLRFDAPAGRYEYLCIVHPFMQGTITVTE